MSKQQVGTSFSIINTMNSETRPKRAQKIGKTLSELQSVWSILCEGLLDTNGTEYNTVTDCSTNRAINVQCKKSCDRWCKALWLMQKISGWSKYLPYVKPAYLCTFLSVKLSERNMARRCPVQLLKEKIGILLAKPPQWLPQRLKQLNFGRRWLRDAKSQRDKTRKIEDQWKYWR